MTSGNVYLLSFWISEEHVIEFETLDSDDIEKILNGTWDIEEKRKKLKAELDLQKKDVPIPPPPPPLSPSNEPGVIHPAVT